MNRQIVKAYGAHRGLTYSQAESEMVRIVTEQATNLSRIPNYRFGYHSREDVRQNAIMFALEAIEDGGYDPTRPLENFSYVHMSNRLLNYKRKHFMRSERPCKCCDPFNPPPEPCEQWTGWNDRNVAKQRLMNTIDVGSVEDEREKSMRVECETERAIEISDTMEKIDRELPVELRGDYLKIKAGVSISKVRRDRVREAILEIFHEEG